MFYIKRKTDFALVILLLLCLLLLVVHQSTLYETLQIYKHYIRILVITIHLYCLLLSVIGMNFQSKLGILQAYLTSSKNSLKSNLIHHPDTITQVKILGQKYHARLRTACSSLRQHLHSKV